MIKNVSMPELVKQDTVGYIDIKIWDDFKAASTEFSKDLNYWKLELYPTNKYVYNESASKKWIEGLTPRQTMFIEDKKATYDGNYGDRYVGCATIYLYSEIEFDLNLRFITVEKGCIYFNDVIVTTIPSWSWTDLINVKFSKGWNKIELIYYTGTGADGFCIRTDDWRCLSDISVRGLTYLYPYKFDTVSTTDIVDTEEDSLKDISIKGITKVNILGDDLYPLLPLDSSGAQLDNKGKPFWSRNIDEQGFLNFRTDQDDPCNAGSGWLWRNICHFDNSIALGLFKPEVEYTITYKVNECVLPERNKYVEYWIYLGSSRWAYTLKPGLHTMTVKANDSIYREKSSLLREMYCGKDNYYLDGERRVYDITFISIVEGTKGELNKTNSLQVLGKMDYGFTIYTQDVKPILGEYTLSQDIALHLSSTENLIEQNINKFEVTWI